jgi:hypothetical protein
MVADHDIRRACGLILDRSSGRDAWLRWNLSSLVSFHSANLSAGNINLQPNHVNHTTRCDNKQVPVNYVKPGHTGHYGIGIRIRSRRLTGRYMSVRRFP